MNKEHNRRLEDVSRTGTGQAGQEIIGEERTDKGKTGQGRKMNRTG